MFNKSSLAMSQRQSWASQARVTIWGLSRKLWAQPLQQPGSRRWKFTQMIQLEIDFATFHLRCSLIYLSWEAFNCFAIRATCRWNADMKSLSTTKRMSWNVSWLLNVCILYWWSCILDDLRAYHRMFLECSKSLLCWASTWRKVKIWSFCNPMRASAS